ncbi:Tetratricopeptide repeat-containing protein [Paucidesulfovibrio gracilis DSM 16080]|uniref:Tetratricopeptide repeat-containing protein n=1 Tax=Paucidesulfovibrio gracilis DSM 16080 TaxID=1121449 RepID=A0A1T4WXP0_9BACT|nr:tetratricopeptide repeat protein [Paucidesulfovibrio gracilis]SKA82076.1 Tetratricopeptide repeat-containing protein [Paucidesulfovibrio gracilis DSM 16080]
MPLFSRTSFIRGAAGLVLLLSLAVLCGPFVRASNVRADTHAPTTRSLPDPKEDRACLQEAGALLDAGEFHKARTLLRTHLQTTGRLPAHGYDPCARDAAENETTADPRHEESRALTATLCLALGNALYMEGEMADAYAAFRSARTGLPEDPAACRNLALAAYGLERWTESAALFETASDLLPSPDPKLLRQAATAWSLGGRDQKAAGTIARALDLVGKPDAEWLELYAHLHTKAGKHLQGLHPLLTALRRAPQRLSLWLALGNAEWRGQRLPRAVAALETALRLRQRSTTSTETEDTVSAATLRRQLDSLYANGGLPAQAAMRLLHRPGEQKTQWLDRAAALFDEAQRPEKALNALQQAQQQQFSRARLLRMARLCMRYGMDRRACDLFLRYLECTGQPGQPSANGRDDIDQVRIQLAICALGIGNHDLARTALKDIPRTSANHAYAAKMLELLAPPAETP